MLFTVHLLIHAVLSSLLHGAEISSSSTAKLSIFQRRPSQWSNVHKHAQKAILQLL